ncbi:hypothetical protein K2X40_00945 [Candidatus Babeliales bacterium]|nr:hypothetical protein [Candidatus Babeliales bacterium]
MIFFNKYTAIFFIVSAITHQLSATPDGYTLGVMRTGEHAVTQTTAEMMLHNAQHAASPNRAPRIYRPFINQARATLPQNPDSPALAQFPTRTPESSEELIRSPQQLGVHFKGTALPELNLFPPDSMGTVGPTQFVVAVNNLIRSFNKTTGLIDGNINIHMDAFFASVSGDITSDPRIRYDRFTNRWFILCIDITRPSNNRILIAVSNTSTITPSTIWSLYAIPAGTGVFYDYPTLGIDQNALYIGGNAFSNSNTGSMFVVRKSSVTSGGPIVYTRFDNLISPQTGRGLFAPQGVDNFDANPTSGYFVGVDNATFGTLIVRRVNDPAGTPSLSPNLIITVPATAYPITVPHLGNTRGTTGKLDGLDDRLICAHIRNNQLWTTHGIGVNNVGISSNRQSITRDGCRWYALNLAPATPTIAQVGTVFDRTTTNLTTGRSYWMPSLMTSGQGHMALGCSVASSGLYANAATVGRLFADTLNTTETVVQITAATTAYNPPGDPGSIREGRRWGDYSYTSLDPCDDMTMWTIQEYCDATNSWGVFVQQLLAPPPAQPISIVPSSLARNQSSVNITVTGQQTGGAAFYDPGANFSCRLAVNIAGVTVNSATFVNGTTITANISTVGATTGAKSITVTNPDGQQRTGNNLLTIT